MGRGLIKKKPRRLPGPGFLNEGASPPFFTRTRKILLFFRYFSSESNSDCLNYTGKCLYTYDKLFSKPALLRHPQMQNSNRIAVLFLGFPKHLQGRYQRINLSILAIPHKSAPNANSISFILLLSNIQYPLRKSAFVYLPSLIGLCPAAVAYHNSLLIFRFVIHKSENFSKQ